MKIRIRSEIITLVSELDKLRDKAGYIINCIPHTKEVTNALETLEVTKTNLQLLADELTEMLAEYDYPNTPLNDQLEA